MALPEIDPSRKIQPRSRGDLRHPGTCACCGGSDPDRTYVDFGIYYDYEGTMYICSTCFTEAVHVMGYFTPDEVEQQLTQLNSLLDENAQLKKELENARPILNAVANLNLSVADPAGDSDSSSDPDSVEDVEGTEAGESEVTESDSSEGRSNASGSKPRDRSKPIIG